MSDPMIPFTTDDVARLLTGSADNAFPDGQHAAATPELERDAALWAAMRPTLVQAPALLKLLDASRQTMMTLRRQVDRLRVFVPDGDEAIGAACDRHDDVAREVDDMIIDLLHTK